MTKNYWLFLGQPTLHIPGQPGLHSKILSLKTPKYPQQMSRILNVLGVAVYNCNLETGLQTETPSQKSKSKDKAFTYTDAISVPLKTTWCMHMRWEWKIKSKTKEKCAIESNHINMENKINLIIITLYYFPQIKIASWARYMPGPERMSLGGQASMNNLARSHFTKQTVLALMFSTNQ